MSLSPFCRILCGGASLLSSSKHISKYSTLLPFFVSAKLLNVDVRRNESLLFITIFEVLNLNN